MKCTKNIDTDHPVFKSEKSFLNYSKYFSFIILTVIPFVINMYINAKYFVNMFHSLPLLLSYIKIMEILAIHSKFILCMQ